jgi:hypothetical protein
MRAVLTVPMIISAALLAGMLFLARRGLDVVDEGYLLRMIATPQATRPAGDVYLFGFVLHPLYELVSTDIAVFRMVGIAVTAGAAALLAHESLGLMKDHGVVLGPMREWSAVLAVAASSMATFSFNVTILAYRSVALLGLMATAAGLARLDRGGSLIGGGLVGIGLWTCFVGKPTSAAALLVVVAAVVLGFRLVSAPMVMSALASGGIAVGLTLLAAGMTPEEMVGYLLRGAHHSHLLGSHSSVGMLLGWGPLRLEGLLVFGPMVLAPFVAGMAFRTHAEQRHIPGADLLTALAVVAAAVVVAWVGARILGPSGYGWQILSLGLVLPVVGLTWLVRDRWREVRHGIPFEVAFVMLLLVLPYVSAVGSNVSFSVGMPLASVFWALALVLVCIRRDVRGSHGSQLFLVLSLVTAVVGAMAWVVHRDGLNGGNLSPVLQAAPVEGGQLMLRPDDARAAWQLRSVANRFRISHETPVVDLTGVGAGYALMSGGRPIARAHMYGYLPNSVNAARSALATATCRERAAAWLIYAPNNWMDISPAFTGDVLSLSQDYETVAEFTSRQVRGTWDMKLLRPLPSVGWKLGC